MNHVIQCFVLFSAIVIVASAVVLLLPLREGGPTAVETTMKHTMENAMETAVETTMETAMEGFQSGNQTLPNARVSAASQPSLSHAAGSADGSSDQQHLLDNLLKKQDKLIEVYGNRRSTPVSATTTQRNALASTSADADE